MTVGKNLEESLNCFRQASCVLCAESEASVIHERASAWHRAGSSHFSPWHAFPELRICHDGNARLGWLTTYPPGGSALTSGHSSIKALVRKLGEAQQRERSLSPPSPATPVARLSSVAQAPAWERCITSPFFLSSLSLSSLLSLPCCSLVSSNLRGTSSKQSCTGASALWSELLEFTGKMLAWVWHWRS